MTDEKLVILTGCYVYQRWKEAVMGRLVKEKVWSVISKGKSTDDQFSEEEKEIIAKGIISSAITDKIRNTFAAHKKAKDLWEALEEAFAKADTNTLQSWKKAMHTVAWEDCNSSILTS